MALHDDGGPPPPLVSVVIPALNEARNLPHVLAAIPDGVHQVILVDGRSQDGTVAVARACRPDIEIVVQTRRGKGNALACGFAAVTGEVIVMLDADGSADPREIGTFVAALTDGADYAKGTRFARGGASKDITRLRRWGNARLNAVVNRLFHAAYSDLCYGYNAFWTRLLPVLDLPPVHLPGQGPDDLLWGDGFEIETLINIRVVEARVRITEVGSVELARLHGASNLHAFSDGLRVLRTAVQERRYRRVRATAQAAARTAATAAVQDALEQFLRTHRVDLTRAPVTATPPQVLVDLTESARADLAAPGSGAGG